MNSEIVEPPQDKDLSDFLESSHSDVLLAKEDLDESDSPHRRRALVRAIFASIEGFISILRSKCLNWADADLADYSNSEIALLREETYSIDNQGSPQIRPSYASVDASYRFVMSAYMRPSVPDFTMDLSGDGWRSFKDTLRIRNRITHPRSAADLEISDADLETAKLAYGWFIHETTKHLLLVVDTLYEQVQEYKRQGLFDGLM